MAQTWYNLQPSTLNVKVYQYQNRQGSEAGYKEVYSGTVRLSAGRHTELVVSRWGKVMFDEFEITQDTWATGFPGLLGQGNTNGQGSTTAVSDAAFFEIKKSLEMEKYADGKLKLFRVLVKNNAFTTNQIAELSSQFVYDSDKLQFLKLAYPSCVDKGNYHVLARLLKYSSDRDDLMNFLAKQ